MLPERATLYCGDISFTFDTPQRFFEMENILEDLIGKEYYDDLVEDRAWISAKRVFMLRTKYHNGIYPALPELIWAAQFHEARDRGTKVFALGGLLSLEEQESPLVLKELPKFAMETFKAVSTHIIQRYQNLDILSYASSQNAERHQKSLKLPSWVPGFGATHRKVKPFAQGIFGPKSSSEPFCAGGQSF